MPLPPIHGLAVLSLYFNNKVRFDPLALVASATFVDLEPLFYIFIGDPLDHQFWHGYALALTIYPLLVTLAVYAAERLLEKKLQSAYSVLRLKPTRVRYPLLNVYLCSLIGSFSHMFFDMFTHEDMPYVIYPLAHGNPFYIGQASGIVEAIAVAFAIYSVFLWLKTPKLSNRPAETAAQALLKLAAALFHRRSEEQGWHLAGLLQKPKKEEKQRLRLGTQHVFPVRA